MKAGETQQLWKGVMAKQLFFKPIELNLNQIFTSRRKHPSD